MIQQVATVFLCVILSFQIWSADIEIENTRTEVQFQAELSNKDRNSQTDDLVVVGNIIKWETVSRDSDWRYGSEDLRTLFAILEIDLVLHKAETGTVVETAGLNHINQGSRIILRWLAEPEERKKLMADYSSKTKIWNLRSIEQAISLHLRSLILKK